MNKIDWRAVVESEDDEELDLKECVEVLSCAINLLINEHNNLVDIVNVLSEDAIKTKENALSMNGMSKDMLGTLGSMFSGMGGNMMGMPNNPMQESTKEEPPTDDIPSDSPIAEEAQ